MVDLAVRYGQYGFRRITALLRAEVWWINHKKSAFGGWKG
jgi:hypothetical protein